MAAGWPLTDFQACQRRDNPLDACTLRLVHPGGSPSIFVVAQSPADLFGVVISWSEGLSSRGHG